MAARAVKVPSGFHVRAWRVAGAPDVTQSHGGALIGSFGYVGDDFASLDCTFERLRARIAHDPEELPEMQLICEQVAMSTCFREQYGPKTRSIRGAIFWTACLDGLTWALADCGVRARLLERFRSFAPHPQWLVLESPPPGDAAQALAGAGVKLLLASHDHDFLLEIERPDGSVLTLPYAGESRHEPDAYEQGSRPMVRAPQLIARLDALAEQGGTAALIESLLAHPAALVFRCNAAGDASLMGWEGLAEPLLPIYPDVATWLRVVHELGEAPGEVQMGSLMPRPLLQSLCEEPQGIAIGWYARAAGGIRYAAVERACLLRLCRKARRPWRNFGWLRSRSGWR